MKKILREYVKMKDSTYYLFLCDFFDLSRNIDE